MNFTKLDSLFNYGMKVSVYSTIKSQDPENPTGWFKGGDRISHYANGIKKDNHIFCNKSYFSLSFNYKFTHDHDTVYFAFSFPYTY